MSNIFVPLAGIAAFTVIALAAIVAIVVLLRDRRQNYLTQHGRVRVDGAGIHLECDGREVTIFAALHQNGEF